LKKKHIKEAFIEKNIGKKKRKKNQALLGLASQTSPPNPFS
jgi:hypothetical protein